MKKKILFLIYFTLNSFLLLAQQNDFTISLPKEGVEQILFDFNIEKIIDARKDKRQIGSFYRTSNQTTSNIVFKQQLETEFLNALEKNDAKGNGKRNLIIRVNEISIEENEEFALVLSFINITFIEHKNNDYIELFTATETVSGKSYKIDRRGLYQSKIIDNLHSCLAEFLRRLNKERLLNQKIEESQIFEPKKPYTLPSLTTLKKGEYKTFYDFRDNTPDSIRVKPIISKSPTINHVRAKLPIDRNQWGFFDGKKIYVKSKGNYYYPLLEDENRLSYYEKIRELSRKLDDKSVSIAVLMTIQHGVIGGLLALILADNIKSDSQEEVALTLNINKGAFELLDEVTESEPRVYVVNSTLSANPPLHIEINDKDTCTILATEYTKYIPKKTEENIKVCLTLGNKEKVCETTQLDKSERTFLEVTLSANGKDLELKWKKEKVANTTLLDNLRKEQYRINCIF